MFPLPKQHSEHFSLIQLDLKSNSESGGDVSTYIENGEWDLIGNSQKVMRILNNLVLCPFYFS